MSRSDTDCPRHVTLEMRWKAQGTQERLYIGSVFCGSVRRQLQNWLVDWADHLADRHEIHPTREAAMQALEQAVMAMGVTQKAMTETDLPSFATPEDLLTELKQDDAADVTIEMETVSVGQHSDDTAVECFALIMKQKLAVAREKGRSSWEDCSDDDLFGMLREHVEKGDMRDVANIAMMIHLNRKRRGEDVGNDQRAADPTAARAARKDEILRRARDAICDVLTEYDRNICTHESTHRGGSIWTICDECGAQWADDRGGFNPYSDPPHIIAARAVVDLIDAEMAREDNP